MSKNLGRMLQHVSLLVFTGCVVDLDIWHFPVQKFHTLDILLGKSYPSPQICLFLISSPMDHDLIVAQTVLLSLPTGITCSEYLMRPPFTPQSWQQFTELWEWSVQEPGGWSSVRINYSEISLRDMHSVYSLVNDIFFAIGGLVYQGVQVVLM